MKASDLEKRLHTEIPLSQFMQVRVIKADEASVELQCPLGPNHNHVGTAFGGSLSCLMILAAYCQIFQLIDENRTQDKTSHVLLKSSSFEFFHPVDKDLKAICKISDLNAAQYFLKTYRKKGRARLILESQIFLPSGQVACQMKAEFVGIV